MDSGSIIHKIGKEQGWNDNSKLRLCLEYIDNQRDNQAFRSFLKRVQAEENEENEHE